MGRIEFWKNIEDYGNGTRYQVSDLGRVRSLNYRDTGEPKILKQYGNGTGYYQVKLLDNFGKAKHVLVHRLVATAFIENPFPDKWDQVNHIDEDKSNNCVENLEWCDQTMNHNHGTINERTSKSMTNNPKRSKPVRCKTTGETFKSIADVFRTYGYSKNSVGECCRGKQKHAYGLEWEFV